MSTYDQVLVTAEGFVESGAPLALQSHRVALGKALAYLPDAPPIDVWLISELQRTLRDAHLWVDDSVVALDHNAFDELGVSDDGRSLHEPSLEVPFVVWADRPLYSGLVHVVLELDGQSPHGVAAITSVRPVESFAEVLAVGRDAGLPDPASQERLPLGCWAAMTLVGLALVVVLALASYGLWQLLAG